MTQHNIRATLVGPSAFYDSPVPRLIISAIRESDPNLPQRHLDESMRILDAQMSQLANSHGAEYISLINLMCSAGSCATQGSNALPLIFDREHFTADGSEYVAKKLMAVGTIW
jgi:SGNH domain-containing protein